MYIYIIKTNNKKMPQRICSFYCTLSFGAQSEFFAILSLVVSAGQQLSRCNSCYLRLRRCELWQWLRTSLYRWRQRRNPCSDSQPCQTLDWKQTTQSNENAKQKLNLYKPRSRKTSTILTIIYRNMWPHTSNWVTCRRISLRATSNNNSALT